MGEETEIKKILDVVQAMQESIGCIQENMATKEDLKGYATKEDLQTFKSEILEHIDGFAQQNQKFDHELVAAQAKFNRVEERVEVLELKAGIGAQYERYCFRH